MKWDESVAVTWKELVVALSVFTIIIFVILIMWYFLDFILLMFTGLLLAILIRLPTNWLKNRTPLSGKWSLLVVFLLFILIASLGIWLVSPSISDQYDQFVEVLPEGVSQVEDAIRQSPLGAQFLDQPINWSGLPSSVGNIFTGVTDVFSSVMNVFTNFIILFFIAFYFSFQPDLYVQGFIRLFPEERRPRVQEVLQALDASLRWWLIGRLLSMFVLGMIVGIGLWILGVPLALFLGILTGLLSFVPTIGGVLAFIPAGLVALSQNGTVLLYVFILYIVAQFIETYLIMPAFVQQAVKLPAVLGILSQLLFGIVAGPLGIAIGYPAAVVALVLIKKLYIESYLGERVSLPGAS
jgi:predicted PurR-regulated permease PerM